MSQLKFIETTFDRMVQVRKGMVKAANKLASNVARGLEITSRHVYQERLFFVDKIDTVLASRFLTLRGNTDSRKSPFMVACVPFVPLFKIPGFPKNAHLLMCQTSDGLMFVFDPEKVVIDRPADLEIFVLQGPILNFSSRPVDIDAIPSHCVLGSGSEVLQFMNTCIEDYNIQTALVGSIRLTILKSYGLNPGIETHGGMLHEKLMKIQKQPDDSDDLATLRKNTSERMLIEERNFYARAYYTLSEVGHEHIPSVPHHGTWDVDSPCFTIQPSIAEMRSLICSVKETKMPRRESLKELKEQFRKQWKPSVSHVAELPSSKISLVSPYRSMAKRLANLGILQAFSLNTKSKA